MSKKYCNSLNTDWKSILDWIRVKDSSGEVKNLNLPLHNV